MPYFLPMPKSLFLESRVPEFLPRTNLWKCFFEDSIVVSTPYILLCKKNFTGFRQSFPCCMAFCLCDWFFRIILYVASYFAAIFPCNVSKFTMFLNYFLLNSFMQDTECSCGFDKVGRKTSWHFGPITFCISVLLQKQWNLLGFF